MIIPDWVPIKFLSIQIVNKTLSDLDKHIYVQVTSMTFGGSLFMSEWLTGPLELV